MSDFAPKESKPEIDQLLIRSALDAGFRQRLVEAPEEVFLDFELTAEQKDLLRQPDHRLLPLLGAALARQPGPSGPSAAAPDDAAVDAGTPSQTTTPAPAAPAAQAAATPRTLPDISLALTVVPCARIEDGEPRGFSYAVWVNPLPEGADPASLPPPPGASLPGQPLSPLNVVIQISALQLQDAAGNAQVGLSASLRQSSNIVGPPSPDSAGTPGAPAFGRDPGSAEVRAAVAAVRNAPRETRYGRIIDLMRVLRGEAAR